MVSVAISPFMEIPVMLALPYRLNASADTADRIRLFGVAVEDLISALVKPAYRNVVIFLPPASAAQRALEELSPTALMAQNKEKKQKKKTPR